jgi:hypothetical protein
MAEPTRTNPPPLPAREATDPDTDANYDYTQAPQSAQDGVPVHEWLPERPFDSAEWMYKDEPVYQTDDEPDPGDAGEKDEGEAE